MAGHTLLIKCTYCGDTLPTELDGQTIVCDEFHDCLGERVGYVGEPMGDTLSLTGAGDFEVVLE